MQKILVRAPNWIGDQIIAYPFFYALRKIFPQAHIVSVCVPWVAALQFRDLINEVRVMEIENSWSLFKRFKNLTAFGRALRKEGPWDRAYSLPLSFSSAWLLACAGATERWGYRTEGRGLFLNRGLKWDPNPNRHRGQAFLDLIDSKKNFSAREFWGAFDDQDERILGEQAYFDARLSWPQARAIDPSRWAAETPYFVIGPGATAPSRRWPVENFVGFAQKIVESKGWKPVLVGGPQEIPLTEIFERKFSHRFVNLVGKAGITELSEVFRSARFTICNESGLAHVASLCGSPVLIVCGAADPRRTEPLGPGRVFVKTNPVECWPCEKNVCYQEHDRKIQCLRGIFPEPLVKEATERF